jgi:hypothetical protein
MKKLLLGATLAMSVIAFATSTDHQTNVRSLDKTYQDTTPKKKKDTTKTPRPDSPPSILPTLMNKQ